MNTLFVTRWRPHAPESGAQLRNWQNIHAMSHFSTVDVVSINHEHEAPASSDVFRYWKHIQLSARPRRGTFKALIDHEYHPLVSQYFSPTALNEIVSLVKEHNYDIVVVEEISLASYVIALTNKVNSLIFDAHNVEAPLRANIESSVAASTLNLARRRLLERRLFRLEKQCINAADWVWACSDIDAHQISQLYHPQNPPLTLPNAVNIVDYASTIPAQRIIAESRKMSLVYIGTMSYQPNESAALCLMNEIVPELRSRGRQLHLTLIGRNPTKQMIDASNRCPESRITGSVDSILPYFSNPCLLVLPITEGSGTRLKILEAFAMGCAVISSAKGAEGVNASPGREITLCESVNQFANSVEDLWDNNERRVLQANAALELVTEHYSWQAVTAKIEEFLKLYDAS